MTTYKDKYAEYEQYSDSLEYGEEVLSFKEWLEATQ